MCVCVEYTIAPSRAGSRESFRARALEPNCTDVTGGGRSSADVTGGGESPRAPHAKRGNVSQTASRRAGDRPRSSRGFRRRTRDPRRARDGREHARRPRGHACGSGGRGARALGNAGARGARAEGRRSSAVDGLQGSRGSRGARGARSRRGSGPPGFALRTPCRPSGRRPFASYSRPIRAL